MTFRNDEEARELRADALQRELDDKEEEIAVLKIRLAESEARAEEVRTGRPSTPPDSQDHAEPVPADAKIAKVFFMTLVFYSPFILLIILLTVFLPECR